MEPNSKATSEKFHNLLDFNGQELAKHPASRMKNHPLSVAYPGIFFGGGGVQQIQLRTEDREDGDLGAVAP